jgi:hypothetical protein
VGLTGLAISSCATTSLVQVWRDPNYSPAPVKRVFIVAVIPYAQDRLSFESAIAASLTRRGFEVATSGGVGPLGPSDNEEIVAYVRETGVDLVVVLRLVTAYGAWYGAADINVYAARTSAEWPVWSGTSSTASSKPGSSSAESTRGAGHP